MIRNRIVTYLKHSVKPLISYVPKPIQGHCSCPLERNGTENTKKKINVRSITSVACVYIHKCPTRFNGKPSLGGLA